MELIACKYNYRLTIGEHNIWLTRDDIDVLRKLIDEAVEPSPARKEVREEQPVLKQWAGMRCLKSMEPGEQRTFTFSPFHSTGGTVKEYVERKWGWKLEMDHERNSNVWTFKRIA